MARWNFLNIKFIKTSEGGRCEELPPVHSVGFGLLVTGDQPSSVDLLHHGLLVGDPHGKVISNSHQELVIDIHGIIIARHVWENLKHKG